MTIHGTPTRLTRRQGTQLTREAHALLAAARGGFHYAGYVEGSDLFRGAIDCIATNGFTGNIVLKTWRASPRARSRVSGLCRPRVVG